MLLINQLSKQTQIPIHTIRFYEKSGLFQGKKDLSKKSNNYTYYDDETIEKLDLIMVAKSVGFTLTEIKELIDTWYNDAISTPEKVAILKHKMLAIDEKIKHLKEVKKQIGVLIKQVEDEEC